MIWNTAQTVMFNGAVVQAVLFNGSKIWPSTSPMPAYSWSASGQLRAATSITNYGLIDHLSVRKFQWLTDTTAEPSALLNSTSWYYKLANNSGRSASANTTPAFYSSFKNVVHTDVWLEMKISGRAGSVADPENYSAVMTIPKMFQGYSGFGVTSVIDGVATTSRTRKDFTKDITGSATITAQSARFGDPSSATQLPTTVSGYGPSVYNLHDTSYNRVGMSANWSASGVYVP